MCPLKDKDLGKLIKDLLAFLYIEEEFEKVVSSPPIVSYRSARKIKGYTVTSNLYHVERRVGCQGCGDPRCHVCENISYWNIHQFYHKRTPIRSIIVLIVMINVWFIYLIVKHVVNLNVQVKLPTISEVSATIINLKLEKLEVVTWKMGSKNSYRAPFYNQIIKAFLKT